MSRERTALLRLGDASLRGVNERWQQGSWLERRHFPPAYSARGQVLLYFLFLREKLKDLTPSSLFVTVLAALLLI